MTEEKNNVIQFNKQIDDPKCSFCKTPKSKSKKMISNIETGKHICDKCIKHAMTRIAEE